MFAKDLDKMVWFWHLEFISGTLKLAIIKIYAPQLTFCSKLEVQVCHAECTEQSANHEIRSSHCHQMQSQARQPASVQCAENAIHTVPKFHHHAFLVSAMGQNGCDDTFDFAGMLQQLRCSSLHRHTVKLVKWHRHPLIHMINSLLTTVSTVLEPLTYWSWNTARIPNFNVQILRTFYSAKENIVYVAKNSVFLHQCIATLESCETLCNLWSEGTTY